MTRDKCPKH